MNYNKYLNKYYIRALPADWPTLLHLGENLGAIALHYEEYVESVDADGTTIRTPVGEPVVSATLGGAWDYIGEIQQPTGVMLTDSEGNQYPETAPIAAADGTPYLHANLITPLALGELAMSMRAEDQTIAQALEQLSKFFLLDADGNARLPSQPHRVFAS